MNTVKVVFYSDMSNEYNPRAKKYSYKTTLEFNEGDLAVVAVPVGPVGDNKVAYKVVKVVEVVAGVLDEATKYIVSKVDLTSYNSIIEREHKREVLLSKMKALADGYARISFFKALANEHPEMAALVKEYEEV